MRELKGRFTPVENLNRALSQSLNQALQAQEPIAVVESTLREAVRTSRCGDPLLRRRFEG
jgi:hypothetical protein